jgi:hypothetical protein
MYGESHLVEESYSIPMNHLFTDQVKDEGWAIPARRYLKKSSTESHCDLNFEGESPGVAPGGTPQNLWQNV